MKTLILYSITLVQRKNGKQGKNQLSKKTKKKDQEPSRINKQKYE